MLQGEVVVEHQKGRLEFRVKMQGPHSTPQSTSGLGGTHLPQSLKEDTLQFGTSLRRIKPNQQSRGKQVTRQSDLIFPRNLEGFLSPVTTLLEVAYSRHRMAKGFTTGTVN